MPVDHVEHPADGAHHDLRAVPEPRGLLADRGAAEDGHHVHAAALAVGAQRLGDLDAELARGGEHDRLDVRVLRVDVVDHRQPEGGGLPGAGLRLADHVASLEERRDRLLLDGRGSLVAQVGERLQRGLREAELGEGRHCGGPDYSAAGELAAPTPPCGTIGCVSGTRKRSLVARRGRGARVGGAPSPASSSGSGSSCRCVSTGVVYLLAVLLVSSYWGLWMGLATAVVSAPRLQLLPHPAHRPVHDRRERELGGARGLPGGGHRHEQPRRRRAHPCGGGRPAPARGGPLGRAGARAAGGIERGGLASRREPAHRQGLRAALGVDRARMGGQRPAPPRASADRRRAAASGPCWCPPTPSARCSTRSRIAWFRASRRSWPRCAGGRSSSRR